MDKESTMELFKDKPELFSNRVFDRKREMVEEVLKMPEWNDPRYKHLLTSTIWHDNIETIRKKLHLSCLQEYPWLFTSSIFLVKIENIIGNIKLFKEYGIDNYVTISAIRYDFKKKRTLLEEMVSQDIALIVEDRRGEKKLNPLIAMSPREADRKLANKFGWESSNEGEKKVRKLRRG